MENELKQGKLGGGFTHELQREGITNDWITPRWLIWAFGEGYFDLDPCESEEQPWPCARVGYTVKDNGLVKPWFGRVWCNPPYGLEIVPWVRKMCEYKNGVLLIFARMDSSYWHDYIFPSNPLILILQGRLQFARPGSGFTDNNNAGAGSALLAWGECKEKMWGMIDSGRMKGTLLMPVDSLILSELEDFQYEKANKG